MQIYFKITFNIIDIVIEVIVILKVIAITSNVI